MGAKASRERKLAVIVHADVIGSTDLVHRNETVAHARITDAFRRFSDAVIAYGGMVREIRGDALVAEFARASDAVSAALVAQLANSAHNDTIDDGIRPDMRVGIALGEVVVADETVTGPGIVLAQRLEQIASSGGVCVQGSVYEAVPGRMPFDYTNLGEQKVKGFDEPVRAFSVVLKPGQEPPRPEAQSSMGTSTGRLRRLYLVGALSALMIVVAGLAASLRPWEPDVEPVDHSKMAIPLPDKPSIAVLPFTNMSDDEDEAFFSDGVTEDIITDLSKISGLFVIARESSFAYKGQPVQIRQVAERLGARFVLQGSVRRTKEKIRITAQLIDAFKGNNIWAERYDRDLEDIFTVQSAVAREVAKTLAVTLKANENERLYQKYTTNIDAYEVFLQARRTVDKPSRDNILRGEELFGHVIELDPDFAGGYAGLSFNYSVQVRFQYSDSPSTHLARAFELANKAVDIDPGYAWGYIALGGAHLANGDADAAVEAVRHALGLEPSGYEANLFMGFYLQFAGEAGRAVEHLQVANRLSPVVTVRDLAFMSLAQFMNRNYAEVVRIAEERERKFPGRGNRNVGVVVAAAHVLLDKPEEASVVVRVLLEDYPDFNLSQWRFGKLWKSDENRTRLYNAAMKAGIPQMPKG